MVYINVVFPPLGRAGIFGTAFFWVFGIHHEINESMGLDTKEVRPADSTAFAILNDKDRTVSEGVLEALANYSITPMPWSKRGEFKEQLAA